MSIDYLEVKRKRYIEIKEKTKENYRYNLE